MVAQAPHVGCLLALPVHRGHRRQHSRRRPCLAPPFAALSPPPEKPDVAEPAPAAPSAGRRWWANNPVGEFIDDRLRADPRYLQKVGIEVGIDSACTLTAELAARGAAAFGAEWVYVCDDLVTTLLLDVAMVSILAPSASQLDATARPPQSVPTAGAAPPSQTSSIDIAAAKLASFVAQAQAVLADCPNSALEAPPAGVGHPGFKPSQRLLTALSTAVQYGFLGLACGGAGQAMTNALVGVAPGVGPAELPGVAPVALLWANYMAVSASIRYQVIAAIEQQAERLPVVGSTPFALTAISATVRLVNNVYGAGLFVNMMRESGISP